MITVAEALAVAKERGFVPADVHELSSDDQVRLDYLEATIDSLIFKNFSGDVIAIPLPVSVDGRVMTTAPVVAAIKHNCELAGWAVGVFPQRDANGEVAVYQLVLIPTSNKAAVTMVQPERVAAVTASAGKRLLVRMPTRGRAEQAVSVLTKYRNMAGCAILMEVVVDSDDTDTLRPEILQKLHALDCVVTVGEHASKIEACNGGRVNEWDVLVLASDDMVPVVDGWAVCVLEEMERHWPHLDGALHFNDGFQRANLCTLPIMGRRLYDQMGAVYDPEYKSLFCDKEFTLMLRDRGRLTYVDEKLIEHRHHAWGRAEKDALYERNDALESADKITYERRAATKRAFAQWRFDSPPLWLSVCIATTAKRRAMLERLLDELYWQQNAGGVQDPREVEILIDDREGVSIGEKRQALLERAHGLFMCYVDDDDMVSHDYLKRVVGALKANPEADCTSLVGVITTDGRNPQRFEHSIKFEKWETVGGKHVRFPNHLNATRRELALQVGFKPMTRAEYFDYSTRIKPLLKIEASTGDDPLYFYFYNSRK